MFAVVCFAVAGLMQRERLRVHFSRGSLGFVILTARSFFQDFSFKFVRLQATTNVILEKTFKAAVASELPILVFMEREILDNHNSPLIQLLENFQVDEV